jgi:hypothetical protein
MELVSLPQLSQTRCLLIWLIGDQDQTRGDESHHRLIDRDMPGVV